MQAEWDVVVRNGPFRETCGVCDSTVRVLGPGVYQCQQHQNHFSIDKIWLNIFDGTIVLPSGRCVFCHHCGGRARHVMYKNRPVQDSLEHVETNKVEFVCEQQYKKHALVR